MRRELVEKTVISVVLTACWLLLPAVGYQDCDIKDAAHYYYMFCHVNIWHLAGNLFVLWLMRGRLYLMPSLLIAYWCSLIPAFSIYGDVGVTIGFSGVLFAIAGIKWGVYCNYASSMGQIFGKTAFHDFLIKALPFAVIGILIPHINWCIHLYCMLLGFVYGRYRR